MCVEKREALQLNVVTQVERHERVVVGNEQHQLSQRAHIEAREVVVVHIQNANFTVLGEGYACKVVVVVDIHLNQVGIVAYIYRADICVLNIQVRQLGEVLNTGEVGDVVVDIQIGEVVDLLGVEIAVTVDVVLTDVILAESVVGEVLLVDGNPIVEAHIELHGIECCRGVGTVVSAFIAVVDLGLGHRHKIVAYGDAIIPINNIAQIEGITARPHRCEEVGARHGVHAWTGLGHVEAASVRRHLRLIATAGAIGELNPISALGIVEQVVVMAQVNFGDMGVEHRQSLQQCILAQVERTQRVVVADEQCQSSQRGDIELGESAEGHVQVFEILVVAQVYRRQIGVVIQVKGYEPVERTHIDGTERSSCHREVFQLEEETYTGEVGHIVAT